MKFTQKKLMSKTTARVHCGWSVPQMSRLNSQIKNMMTNKWREALLLKENLDNASFFHSVSSRQCGMIPLGREPLTFCFDNAVLPSSNSTIEIRGKFSNLIIPFSQFISEVEPPKIFIFLIPLCTAIF